MPCGAVVTEWLISYIFSFSPINRNIRFTPTFTLMETKQKTESITMETELPEGYKREMLTIDIVKANIFAILMAIPVALIYGIPYVLLWHNRVDVVGQSSSVFSGANMLVTLASMFIGIVAHELIHGVTWAIHAKRGFRSIRFGIMLKMVTPYCHCKEALQVKHYIIGAITPAIILGLLPAIYGIATGSVGTLLFGGFFTIAAGGDFMIIYLLRNEKMETMVEDHPSEAGCYVYRKTESETMG